MHWNTGWVVLCPIFPVVLHFVNHPSRPSRARRRYTTSSAWSVGRQRSHEPIFLCPRLWAQNGPFFCYPFGIYFGTLSTPEVYLGSCLTCIRPTIWHLFPNPLWTPHWASIPNVNKSQSAMRTEMWNSQLGSNSAQWNLEFAIKSGSAGWDLEVPVGVKQCPFKFGTRHGGPAVPTEIRARSWGPWGSAVPTEIWHSRLKPGGSHCNLI